MAKKKKEDNAQPDTSSDRSLNLDRLLHEWDYDPTSVNVRLAAGEDGRELIQMRVELGILQLETSDRPDGSRPEGFSSYLEYLRQQAKEVGDEFELDEDECFECDREFVQFYHRRICWLALERYADAVRDADHTLALMDVCRTYSSDEEWTLSHEQYRPFVMYHRIQADAMCHIVAGSPENAVQAINLGLDQVRQVFVDYQIEERFDEDQLVQRLVDLREALRDQFHVGRTLQEQLADAIAAEQYELAAELRDRLAKNSSGLR